MRNARRQTKAHSARVHGSDLETRGVEAEDLLLEVVGGCKGLVAEVGIVLEGEGEFAVGELAGRDCCDARQYRRDGEPERGGVDVRCAWLSQRNMAFQGKRRA